MSSRTPKSVSKVDSSAVGVTLNPGSPNRLYFRYLPRTAPQVSGPLAV